MKICSGCFAQSARAHHPLLWSPVCDNCFELDAKIYLAIILADMGLTVVVMVTVYKCTKKRSSAGLPHGPKGTDVGPPAPEGAGLRTFLDRFPAFSQLADDI